MPPYPIRQHAEQLEHNVHAYRCLDFNSTDLSAAQPLGDDPLGRGRDAQKPYRELDTDEVQLEIPLDLRGTGFWLSGLSAIR